MVTKKKVAYALKRYGLTYKCRCKKCKHQVIQSFMKGYSHFCPNCQQSLFNEEVIISRQPIDTSNRVQLIQDLTKFYE